MRHRMIPALTTALVAGTALLATPMAGAADQAQPTIKDRLDAAVSTVTGAPRRNRIGNVR